MDLLELRFQACGCQLCPRYIPAHLGLVDVGKLGHGSLKQVDRFHLGRFMKCTPCGILVEELLVGGVADVIRCILANHTGLVLAKHVSPPSPKTPSPFPPRPPPPKNMFFEFPKKK